METPNFRYSNIKTQMCNIVSQLDEAGYPEESAAMASLTHIIASRVEPIDVSGKWGVEYLLECVEHHYSLMKYINERGQV